jgi:hypothetical protein
MAINGVPAKKQIVVSILQKYHLRQYLDSINLPLKEAN